MLIIDCTAPEGNVFLILALARGALTDLGHDRQFIDEFSAKAMSGNYANALSVVEEYLGEHITFINKPS